MKTVCLYFQVHQPFRLKRYRFFNIGHDQYYYDDYANESILRKVAEKCYLPANKLLLDLINTHKGNFKVAFSISGMALDQFELYAPDVLQSFRELVDTGSVELLAETNAHSLVALKSEKEFARQVKIHGERIKKHFGYEPKVFRNTELIYSDQMGLMVSKMGYKGMVTEGAKHILGWKSPNMIYCNALEPKLKLMLRNFKLSDDIAFRFSNKDWNEYPLTAEKFAGWIKALPQNEEVINLFMDYETFGEHQWEETGIFDFLKALPDTFLSSEEIGFSTPSEMIEKHQPVAAIHVPHPISWADEEKDLTAWLGNELQDEAFNKLYQLEDMVLRINDTHILNDWGNLQTSDHFYYMCTKFFSDGDVHAYFNPYDSPYDAFLNYMNVLSDFALRIESSLPETGPPIEELRELIESKDKEIEKLKTSLERLKKSSKPVPKKPASSRKTSGTGQTQVKPTKKVASKTSRKK